MEVIRNKFDDIEQYTNMTKEQFLRIFKLCSKDNSQILCLMQGTSNGFISITYCVRYIDEGTPGNMYENS